MLPWECWLRRELRQPIAECLHDRGAIAAAGLELPAVESIWQQFLTGRPGVRASDVLGLVNILQWVRRHRIDGTTDERTTLDDPEGASVESFARSIA